MNTEKFILIAIESTHLVIKLEQLFLKKNISVRVIPLPSELKASCGLSLKVNLNDKDKIKTVLNEENISSSVYKLYICEKNGLKKTFFPFNLD